MFVGSSCSASLNGIQGIVIGSLNNVPASPGSHEELAPPPRLSASSCLSLRICLLLSGPIPVQNAGGMSEGLVVLLTRFFSMTFPSSSYMGTSVCGVFGGTLALYAHWVVWADLMLNSGEVIGSSRFGILSSSTNFDQLLLLAQNPKALFELMSEVSKYGSWSIFGFTVSGVLLWIVWILPET